MEIWRVRRAEHAAEEEVRFERSIDPRSARTELGLCVAMEGLDFVIETISQPYAQ
jgi:hypothetical protein